MPRKAATPPMKARQHFIAFTFAVSGHGYFPVDMLRYDRCAPLRQDDVSSMFDTLRHYRRVELIGYVPASCPADQIGPMLARWGSFGWSVDTSSIKVL